MIKLIFISLLSILFLGCTEESKEKDELLDKIEGLQKSNDALQKKNDSLSTLHVDIPDVVITENKKTTSDSKPNKRIEEIEEKEEDKEELTENDPDNRVSNPFGGRSDNSFGTSDNYSFGPGDGQSDGGNQGNGQGFGYPIRLNNPAPPEYDTDYSGHVCVELLIDDRGAAISAKSCNSTTHPEEAVIDSVVLYIAKHIRFKAEKGAPNRKAFYTVYIQAG